MRKYGIEIYLTAKFKCTYLDSMKGIILTTYFEEISLPF